jgi:protein tyrosine phosphatase (PTP) superfamily phosphohydrolase (DUF442 family)
MRGLYWSPVLLAALAVLAMPVRAQQVTKETVKGVTNFARVGTTVACAGAITSEAVPEIKKMGFKSIIDLRLASEPGANIEEEAAACKAADIAFVHIPFQTASRDSAAVDTFLKTITSPGTEPAFIH